jgi:hypothetical protein
MVPEAFERLSGMVDTRRTCVVFYCEFSSHRAPRVAQAWRTLDQRGVQAELGCEFRVEALRCPSVFLLEGGYSAFFGAFRETEPGLFTGGYVKEKDKAHREEAAHWHRRLAERKMAAARPKGGWASEGRILRGAFDGQEEDW